MSFTSLNDLYFIATALMGYEILFDVIVSSGIIYVPFIVVIFEAFGEGMKSSRAMTDSSFTLKTLEVKVYSMLFTFVVFVAPVINFEIAEMVPYAKSCQSNGQRSVLDDDLGSEGGKLTGTGSNAPVALSGTLLQIDNMQLKVPAIMHLVMSLGTGFSLEAVRHLPCTINLTGVSNELLKVQIQDPQLLLETSSFVRVCYGQAKQWADLSGEELPWTNQGHMADAGGDKPWPGHAYFMDDNYYGNVNRGAQSPSLIAGFQGSQHNRDRLEWAQSADAEAADTTGTLCDNNAGCIHKTGGFPSCMEWWNGLGSNANSVVFSSTNESLRSRLIGNMESYQGLKQDLRDVFDFIVPNSTLRQQEDKVLEMAYFNSYAMSRIKNAETRDYADQTEGGGSWVMGMVSRALGSAGVLYTSLESYATASLGQLLAPIAKGLLMFTIIIVLPLAVIASNISLKFLFSIHFILFSVFLWPFYWEVIILVQQSYVREVMGESGMGILTQPNVVQGMNRLTDALFLAIPMISTTLLAAAGMSVGTQMASMTGAGSMGADAAKGGGKSGAKMGGKGASLAKTAATKGIK